MQPRLDILAHGLPDELTAFRIEAAIIDVLRPGKSLLNPVRGFRALQFGRLPLNELLTALYAALEVDITEPVLLIRINQLYRPGMSDLELYEATRGIWKVGPRRERAHYAVAIFQEVVREVYKINDWHPAATTPLSNTSIRGTESSAALGIHGTIAHNLSRKYRNGLIHQLIDSRSQNLVTYLNC